MIDDTGRYVFSTVEYGQGGPSCTHLIVLAGTTYVTCFLQIGSSKDMVPQNVSWLIIMFTEENAKKKQDTMSGRTHTIQKDSKRGHGPI